jgi:CspA family cold shock protein
VTEKETGTVKWFNDAKGYGFIARDAGEDVFVHYSSVEGDGFRTLREDDRVEFAVEQGPKGLQATQVRTL